MPKTEKEKMQCGEYYDASDEVLTRERGDAKSLLFELNHTHPEEKDKIQQLFSQLIRPKGSFHIETPFYCDYGYHIQVGDGFYANHGCIILDVCKVTIGDHVLLGPNVQIYTAGHPLDTEERRAGKEFGKPIEIGSDVWIGGGTIICPGVKIGGGVTIGAGSVVTKDIPANSVAVGNPCRVVKVVGE